MGTEAKRRGRPAVEGAGRKSASLKFRTRGDLRARIDEAAAAAGMSSSEYVEQALKQHFLATDLRQIVSEEIAAALSVSHSVTVRLPRAKPMNDAMIARFYGRDHLPS